MTYTEGQVPKHCTSRTVRNYNQRVVYYDGVAFLEIPEEDTLEIRAEDSYYIVKPGDEGRLDIIAKDFYGDPTLWWLIAQANEIFNPFTEMYVGMTLRLPPRSVLEGR